MDSIWTNRDRIDRELKTVKYDDLDYDPDLGLYLLHNEPFTGNCAQRHPNGTLESLVQYANGLNCGVSVIWYGDGQIKKYSELRDGVRDGFYSEWAQDGSLVSEKYFKLGQVVSG